MLYQTFRLYQILPVILVSSCWINIKMFKIDFPKLYKIVL